MGRKAKYTQEQKVQACEDSFALTLKQTIHFLTTISIMLELIFLPFNPIHSHYQI